MSSTPSPAISRAQRTWHSMARGPARFARNARFTSTCSPRNNACPAGENVQGWLAHAQAGAYEKAWQVLMQDNPMPAVHGRVCYHPCENHCNRNEVDSSVSIHAVERFLGDLALQQGWKIKVDAPPSGRRIMVGAPGPAACRRPITLPVWGIPWRFSKPDPWRAA